MSNSEVARGGKSVYGAAIGILMLEARFPRIPGDMGNARTWPFPVHYKVVRGASPKRVVTERAQGLLPAFLAGAEELVSAGVDGLTTNCGFLSLFQAELAAHTRLPVATSSLMQIPFIERTLPPGRRVGVITISSASLGEDHLRAAGVDTDVPIVGTEDGTELTRAIVNDEAELDIGAAERDVLDAGARLVAAHPEVAAIVLECTNMSPYAWALRRHVGRPVFDIFGFVSWFQSGLEPKRFARG